MTYLRHKLELLATYCAIGFGAALGVTAVMELFDLRIVLILHTGAGG